MVADLSGECHKVPYLTQSQNVPNVLRRGPRFSGAAVDLFGSSVVDEEVFELLFQHLHGEGLQVVGHVFLLPLGQAY